MISIAAAITKSDIGTCCQEYGKTNSKKFQGHDVGELVYETFAGALSTETGLYEGEHRFALCDGSGCEGCDFNKLPGVLKK